MLLPVSSCTQQPGIILYSPQQSTGNISAVFPAQQDFAAIHGFQIGHESLRVFVRNVTSILLNTGICLLCPLCNTSLTNLHFRIPIRKHPTQTYQSAKLSVHLSLPFLTKTGIEICSLFWQISMPVLPVRAGAAPSCGSRMDSHRTNRWGVSRGTQSLWLWAIQ